MSRLPLNIFERFEILKKRWQEQIGHFSSMHEKYMQEDYQEIIRMGKPAISLILEDIKKNGANHWDWALQRIARINPVPAWAKGNIKAICNIWLEWGKEKKYIS